MINQQLEVFVGFGNRFSSLYMILIDFCFINMPTEESKERHKKKALRILAKHYDEISILAAKYGIDEAYEKTKRLAEAKKEDEAFVDFFFLNNCDMDKLREEMEMVINQKPKQVQPVSEGVVLDNTGQKSPDTSNQTLPSKVGNKDGQSQSFYLEEMMARFFVTNIVARLSFSDMTDKDKLSIFSKLLKREIRQNTKVAPLEEIEKFVNLFMQKYEHLIKEEIDKAVENDIPF